MKAIIYKEYGDPSVLKLSDEVKPTPGENDVLIRIKAVEVTKADCEIRRFQFAVKWFWLPLRLAMGVIKPRKQILGGYFAGEIAAVGQAVKKFSLGDRVFGVCGAALGAYAEYVVLPERYTMVSMPRNASFEEAAAVPLGGLNALHFMRKAAIKKGEKVLINGAGGSIGAFAVQIAKSMGAEVTAVDSSHKKEMLYKMGADYFIDYRREDFSENGQRYDVIFNMVVGDFYRKAVRSLKPSGRYLLGNPTVMDMLKSFITAVCTDKTVIFAFAGEKEEELLTLKEMVEEGTIKPIIDKVYQPEQAAEAHHRVETEKRVGMVVMSFNALSRD